MMPMMWAANSLGETDYTNLFQPLQTKWFFCGKKVQVLVIGVYKHRSYEYSRHKKTTTVQTFNVTYTRNCKIKFCQLTENAYFCSRKPTAWFTERKRVFSIPRM